MKTSNKIILVLILVFVLSPVIAGMVIMQGVKRNVEAGMAYEKKLMKDPLVIRPGDFHALSIELNEASNATIANYDSCMVVFNNVNQSNLKYVNENGYLKISHFNNLPYYKIVSNSFFRLYVTMRAPDIEIYAPRLDYVGAERGKLIFTNYQCDTMLIAGNNIDVKGKIQTKQIYIHTSHGSFEFDSCATVNASFNVVNNSKIVWGSVLDSLNVSGHSNGYIRLFAKPNNINFLKGAVPRQMAVMIPDSTGKMVNVAAKR